MTLQNDLRNFTERQIKTFILERFTYYKNIRCPYGELIRPEFQVYFRRELEESIIQLCVFLAGKEQRNEVVINIPLTWIDWFKEKHKNNQIVKWWIKKHPIRYKEHKYNLIKRTVFPDLELPPNFHERSRIQYIYWDVERL